jgi:flagellin
MSVINTNVSSLQAQNSLRLNETKLSSSMSRLSSGIRINSAKDDAAGLAITTRMTSEIRGLNQAVRNANDGISVAQIAEGALGEITNILQRLREISVQSANASNNDTDRSFLNTEALQLTDEVMRIGTQTNFNGIKLLDGGFNSKQFQVGSNNGETITFSSIGDSRASALGANSLVLDGTVTSVTKAAGADLTGGNTVGAETDLTLSTANGGTTSAISYSANDDAKAVALAINNAANSIGIQATATNSATLGTLGSSGTVGMTLNGQSISAVVNSTTDLTALASAINGQTGNTSITATFANNNDKSVMTLTSADGRDISILNFTNSGATKTASFSGVTLTGGAGTDSSIKTGTVSLISSKGAITAANANADVFASAGTVTSTLTSVSGIDISTVANANSALTTIDAALTQVNNTRAGLGGLMNRFEAAISNQNTAITNLSASRSRILDTDYAVETTNLAKAQIIQQAATAMLAQANQSSQSVLALLK